MADCPINITVVDGEVNLLYVLKMFQFRTATELRLTPILAFETFGWLFVTLACVMVFHTFARRALNTTICEH